MDTWFKDILPDRDPYHNRGRDQMRKKGGSGIRVPVERTTDHGQATGKLYHLRLRVECTFFCNLQSRARTHAVLVIGLYELCR